MYALRHWTAGLLAPQQGDMQISVIIPAYNAARYLPETIESVLAQTVSDWELIIVDDGSNDATLEIARSYAAGDARIRAYTQANGGVASARNAGFVVSDRAAPYICYLDNDDAWQPDALATLLSALESRPDAVAACGLPESMDAYGEPFANDTVQAYCRERYAVQGAALVRVTEDAPTTFACLAVRNCIITPGLVMIRRSAHERAGTFDESLSGCDDWDMWLRLCRFGDIAFVNRVVLRYRLHAANQTLLHNAMDRGETLLYAKLFAYAEETPQRREQLRAGYRFRARLNAQDRIRWARDAAQHGSVLPALRQARHALRLYYRSVAGPRPR
jgi:glycosyltransferase involved in cell wall biosynthesis